MPFFAIGLVDAAGAAGHNGATSGRSNAADPHRVRQERVVDLSRPTTPSPPLFRIAGSLQPERIRGQSSRNRQVPSAGQTGQFADGVGEGFVGEVGIEAGEGVTPGGIRGRQGCNRTTRHGELSGAISGPWTRVQPRSVSQARAACSTRDSEKELT